MKIGKAICSLLLASSAGFAMGLLFAPDKGSQIRRRIKLKAEDFLEDEIITYNRIVCTVKAKLDEILDVLPVQAKR